MSIEAQHWVDVTGLHQQAWTCGHCNCVTGNNVGYRHHRSDVAIYICPACGRPTFFEAGKQVPGASFGKNVDKLPDDVNALYQEARNCMTVSACTAAALTCRKILMHVAVEQGAKAGDTFTTYVGYLVDGEILGKRHRGWVDEIRSRSNEPNHQIVLVSRKDAEDLLSFTELLLKLVYEHPLPQP